MKRLERGGLIITLRNGGYGEDEFYIRVNGLDYATIRGVHYQDSTCLDEIIRWVVETYCSDANSPAYIIPAIPERNFAS